MIKPKVLNELVNKATAEFNVQAIFVANRDGQILSISGNAKNTLVSNISILFGDCQEIGKFLLNDEMNLQYMFAELENLQTIISNFENLFYVGIISNDPKTGILVQYMKKLHQYIEQIK